MKKADMKKQEINVSKDGPYLVSGMPLKKEIIICDEDEEPLKWKDGENCPVPENYALCRCGKSGNKPFCDATHAAIKFDGTEIADNRKYADIAEKYPGSKVDLNDAESLCSGAGFCHRQGGTWELTENSSKIESKKLAIEQACNCPSGRLVIFDKDKKIIIEPKFEKSISLVEDPERKNSGPIWVKGRVLIKSCDGKEYETRNRVTLCRCGKSKNKPFCDASHLS